MNKQEDVVARHYPINEIFADPQFNCRGHISPLDVIDLARDIEEHGLHQPILIMPRRPNDPPEYKWVVVAGHRRHKAHLVNKAETILCIVKENLSDMEARVINASENLKRQNLNDMQEARAIEPMVKAGWNREEIGTALGVSPGWVQMRMMMLNMQPEIQDAIAAGLIRQEEVRKLNSVKDSVRRMEMAKAFKELNQRKAKVEDKALIRKPPKPTDKRIRKKPEVAAMKHHLMNTFGECLASVLLGWVGGFNTDLEIYTEIAKEAGKKNVPYKMPTFDEGPRQREPNRN